MKIVGATGLGGLSFSIQLYIFGSLRDIRVYIYDSLKIVGGLLSLK